MVESIETDISIGIHEFALHEYIYEFFEERYVSSVDCIL